MITDNLSTLKIYKLTQEQYDEKIASGDIERNALYLTPNEATDLSSYITITQLNERLIDKADTNHTHDDCYYTEAEIDEKIDRITNGTTVVQEATHATSADSATTAATATEADHATTADSATTAASANEATKATQDASGNVISETYATKSDLESHIDDADVHITEAERTKLSGIETGAQVNSITGVKGDSESSYRTGDVNITKVNIGLGNVDNTSDADKPVSTAQQAAIDSAVATITSGDVVVAEATHSVSADTADSATTAESAAKAVEAETAITAETAESATKATQDAAGNVIVSTYETKIDATAKLTEAKAYTDTAINSLGDTYYTETEIDAKIDAIVGEGAAETLDTIGEISAAITENESMLDTLNAAIGNKQNTVTGAAVTIVDSDLTASMALVSDEIGKVAVSDVTSTELGYLSGVTSDIQAQIDGKISILGYAATSTDGIAYTATVEGVTSLTTGISFVMIPNMNSTTTTPTLNVNGLGAKGLRMRGSSSTGTAMTASLAAWISANRSVQVTYNGIYWVAEVTRPAATDLSGVVPVANGGTGATDAETARTNLGVPVIQMITWEEGD